MADESYKFTYTPDEISAQLAAAYPELSQETPTLTPKETKAAPAPKGPTSLGGGFKRAGGPVKAAPAPAPATQAQPTQEIVAALLGGGEPPPEIQAMAAQRMREEGVQPGTGPAAMAPTPGPMPGMGLKKATVTPGQNLPEEQAYIEDMYKGAQEMIHLSEAAATQGKARQAMVEARLSAMQAEQAKKQADFLAGEQARYDAAAKQVDDKIKGLQSFQEKSLWDQSPGRAIAAMIGLAFSGAAAGLGNPAGASMVNNIMGIIKDHAEKQWTGQVEGVRGAERKLYDQLKMSDSRADFERASEAAALNGVLREIDAYMKQPLPADVQQKALKLRLDFEGKLGTVVKDLAHSRAGSTKLYEVAQQAASNVAATGGPGATEEEEQRLLSGMTPRDRAMVEHQIQVRQKTLLDKRIPEQRRVLDKLGAMVNSPQAAAHVGIFNTFMSGITGLGTAKLGAMDQLKLKTMETYDPQAYEFYNLLNSAVAELEMATGGKALTETEAGIGLRRALAAGDLEGIKMGVQRMQATIAEEAAAADGFLNPTARRVAALRDARGGLGYSQPRSTTLPYGGAPPGGVQPNADVPQGFKPQ